MATSDDQEKETFTTRNIVVVFVIVLVLGVLIGFVPWIVFARWPSANNAFPSNAGMWGDSFGFVNAIMSSLGLAGILITLWMQRTELKLQRDEMRLTRREFSETREEHKRMADSQEAAATQQLLATYMNALESIRQLTEWRIANDPPRQSQATYRIVEGEIDQIRVRQALHLLLLELELQVGEKLKSILAVAEPGSQFQRLDEILAKCRMIKFIADSFDSDSYDIEWFKGQVNIAEQAFERVGQLAENMPSYWKSQTKAILLDAAPRIHFLSGMFDEGIQSHEMRVQYVRDLKETYNRLLVVVLNLCVE